MIRARQKKLIKKQIEKQIMLASAVTIACVAFLVLYRLLNRARGAAEQLENEPGIMSDEDIGVFEKIGASQDTAVSEDTEVPEDTAASEEAGDSENPVISEELEVY
jgi:hypothetical protein